MRFAEAIGLAFQVTDDVLDVTGDSAQLGKTAGKDERAEKSTYVSTLGLSGAQQEAERLLLEATDALSVFGDRATPLRSLAARNGQTRYLIQLAVAQLRSGTDQAGPITSRASVRIMPAIAPAARSSRTTPQPPGNRRSNTFTGQGFTIS